MKNLGNSKPRQTAYFEALALEDGTGMALASVHAKRKLQEVLTQSLAAYVLVRSNEPISEVLSDLLEIEINAASLVGSYYENLENLPNLKGSLASIFSFVPVGGKKSEKDATAKESQINFAVPVPTIK